MKVLYLNYLYDIKKSSVGASVHVQELSKALKECGYEVKTCFLNRFTSVESSVENKPRKFLKNILWRYLNQINALLANGRYFIKELRLINRERPHLLFVRYNLLNFSFVCVARIKKIPFVLEVNGPMAYENRHFSEHIIRLSILSEFLEKITLKMADAIYVVSQELKDYYVGWHIRPDKIFVIPNGVDIKRIHPGIDAGEIISKFKLERQTVVGFVGSFHYWHGVEGMLQFIKLILNQHRHVVFLLVGEGPLRKSLQRQLRNTQFSDRVHFSGYVPYQEVPKYLAAMDVALAPYPNIPFFYYSPLKIYEYLAAGCCVVAAGIGQIKKIIQDGKNGMLFEPNNMDVFIQKTIKVINNKQLRLKLAHNGRQMIEEKFAWYHAAEKISYIFDSVMKRQGSCK